MYGIDPDGVAWDLFQTYVIDTGYTPPSCYDELLLFVNLSECTVIQGECPPDGFTGVQIGGGVYVSGSGLLSDRERMVILAHEWAHWMRRESGALRRAYLYGGEAAAQDAEEQIAVAFQRLF